MSKMTWAGVMPAITTPFTPDLDVDFSFLEKHVQWLVEHGSTAIVPLGSLGEGATLHFDEKVSILERCVQSLGSKAPVVAGISSLSTAEAVELARKAESVGCQGLMVLPPYVYSTDWREMKAHVVAVLEATELSCMLYNNPIAYGTDFVLEQIGELANEFPRLEAVKESSGDVRRVTAIRSSLGDRLAVFAGLDDIVVECVAAGATGWIAGLVNALPAESIRLFNAALAGESEEVAEIYRWFLPLLRLDTVPKFVQLIKLTQELADMGHRRVRPPRLEVVGDELQAATEIIEAALRTRPKGI